MDEDQVLAAGAGEVGEVGLQGLPEMAVGVDGEDRRAAAAAAVASQQEELQVPLDEDPEAGERGDRQDGPAVPGGIAALDVLRRGGQQRPCLDRRLAGGRAAFLPVPAAARSPRRPSAPAPARCEFRGV
jgi:hypothetical protein